MKGGGRRPVRIADVLEGYLEDSGMKDQIDRMGALELWPELVGGPIAKVTRPRGVSQSTLFVGVETSAWLMELNMMKGEFLRRLNERLEGAPLERIVFVLAEEG